VLALCGGVESYADGVYTTVIKVKTLTMDHSPINQNFDLNKSKQNFHHSMKEHHKISNIPKFRCEML
jgi:hypothetical protein